MHSKVDLISPWSETTTDVIHSLSTDSRSGLSLKDIPKKHEQFGPNLISIKKKASRWILFFKQFKNPVVYVLMIASIIAFVLKEYLDAWTILAIVILNSIIGYLQEAKAETSLEALAALTSPKSRVIRNGVTTLIDSQEIYPGDILIVEAGDYVAADARVILANQLGSDESILTGESLPVDKYTATLSKSVPLAGRSNMLFASTMISKGSGRAVVTQTGKDTEIGLISQMMETTKSGSTPLQMRLEGVSRRLIYLAIIIVGLIIAIGLFQNTNAITIVMSALSLSIAAIPEGLPTVVTLALVMAIHRMSTKKALVRKLDAVETLGATDIICTDKTGTLTTGKMKVRESYISPSQSDHHYSGLAFCNNASLDHGGSGDTTELALLEYMVDEKVDLQKLTKSGHRLFEWSFESIRKLMSVAIQINDRCFIYVKGAPESVLSKCQMNRNEKEEVHKHINFFSQKGMRVLAFAFKEIQVGEASGLSQDVAEEGLTFVSLVAMADPPRPESSEAIKKCLDAGIKVIMITGDHPKTAEAIAKELNIIDEERNLVLTGTQMDALSDSELINQIEKIAVYARVSPSNKLRLVNVLKGLGHVVAMTGDGVNDAPALKASSIGVAMGKGGTEVARQAASIVLTDDNFSSIVDAVEEGRAVNGNIKRSLQYLLSTNLAELLFILGAVIIGWQAPLLPTNILWVNLVTDGLPALALATEKVPFGYLANSSRPSAKSFFDPAFYMELFLVAILITILCISIYYYSLSRYDLLTSRNIAFSFLVYVVLFRSFASRSETVTFWEMPFNRPHLLAVLLPLLFQLGIQKSDFLMALFKIKALPLNISLMLIVIATIPVTLIELFKIWRRQ
jgi:Ca2+-transporting ATPase